MPLFMGTAGLLRITLRTLHYVRTDLQGPDFSGGAVASLSNINFKFRRFGISMSDCMTRYLSDQLSQKTSD